MTILLGAAPPAQRRTGDAVTGTPPRRAGTSGGTVIDPPPGWFAMPVAARHGRWISAITRPRRPDGEVVT